MASEFEILEGEVWAGNFFSRHLDRVSGLTIGSSFKWDLALDMTACPNGTTIKLCGVAAASPFRFQRVVKGSRDHLWSWTHEDSDRFIATKAGRKIRLRSYAYRQGNGPSTTGVSFGGTVTEVADGSRFQLYIDHKDDKTEYTVKDLYGDREHATVPRTKGQGFLKHRTFAHANSYKQPNSPANIRITVF